MLETSEVFVGIVHYGDESLTVSTVNSVLSTAGRPTIAVVSNEVTRFSLPLDPRVQRHYLGTNKGYAGAVNYILETARREGFKAAWILNNDVQVAPDALETLLDTAARWPTADVIGSYVRNGQAAYYAGGRFDKRFGRGTNVGFGQSIHDFDISGRATLTDWINGASMLIPIDAYQRRGAFREDYFLYKEELEWQIRPPAAQAVIVQRFLIDHTAGSSGGSRAGTGYFMMARNGLRLAFDHAGWALPIWLSYWALEYLAVPLARRDMQRLRLSRRAIATLRLPTQSALETMK